ncbi:MAG TPA: hypothetical protein VML50_00070 [Anaeromyxobacter sp.]|nr:hypothetical protein [Anaeromyxobacter sp.]
MVRIIAQEAGGAAAVPEVQGPAEDLRCGCGSLLARVVGGEVELKCRRCKQTWRIPLERS